MVNLYFCGKDIRVYDSNKRVIYLRENTPPPLKKMKNKNNQLHNSQKKFSHDSDKNPTKNTKIN